MIEGSILKADDGVVLAVVGVAVLCSYTQANLCG